MPLDSFDDFLQALDDRPEWRERLRRVVLTDRLLSLPDAVASLAEAQAATERRLEALAVGMDALASAQERTEREIEKLVGQVHTVAGRTDRAPGSMNELRYRTNAPGYFGAIARRVRVLSHDELDDVLDPAVRAGTLLDDEAEELRRADAVMRGRRHGEEAFLVLEASFAIRLDDVARAHRRAELLAATGVTALPVVAGDSADPETQAAARRLGVWQVTDGQVVPPTGAAA
ncbi:MAG: hypothetical protein M3O86_00830 [Actinomycetota bacterium]|nr:hypothetical protein [Actinomycetota bacterium]